MTLPYSFSAGQTAKAAEVNADFIYVQDKITQTATALQTSVNSVQNSLSTVNSECVHKTGNETIAGNKTFSGTVALNGTATALTQAEGNNSTNIATTAFVATTVKTGRYNDMPKYQSRSTRSANTWYHETDHSGYLFISTDISDGNNYGAWSLYIGTSSSDYQTFKVKPSSCVPSTGRDNAAIMVPIAKGYYYKISANIGISQFYFIRTIGE